MYTTFRITTVLEGDEGWVQNFLVLIRPKICGCPVCAGCFELVRDRELESQGRFPGLPGVNVNPLNRFVLGRLTGFLERNNYVVGEGFCNHNDNRQQGKGDSMPLSFIFQPSRAFFTMFSHIF